MQKVTLLFIPQAKPVLLGIYENSNLIKTISSEQNASEFIPEILSRLQAEFKIENIIYSNGPGSFMGIKVAYITLSSYSIIKDINLFAVSGFELNSQGAIRANNKLSFVLDNNKITLAKKKPSEFVLPQNLSKLNLSDDILPNYILSAV